MKEKCRETLQMAYLYLDGEGLTIEQRTEIQVHLEDCRPCLERYGLETEITTIVARLKGHSHCPDELKARISRLLDEV